MREKVIRCSIDGSMEMVDLLKKRDVSAVLMSPASDTHTHLEVPNR